MKRSAAITITIMAAAGLAACEPAVDVSSFQNVAACVASGQFSAGQCQSNFDEAERVHRESAPKFASRDDCEDEFGAGSCGEAPPSASGGGGGSAFMPFLMGYMMGNSGGSSVAAQPLYRSKNGMFSTASGYSVGNTYGKSSISQSAGAKPSAAVGTVARGSFGRSFGGGIGG